MTESTKSRSLSRKGRATPKPRYYEKTLLSEWLRRERKSRSLEQGEMAKILGLNKTKASRIETSEILVSDEVLHSYNRSWPDMPVTVLQMARDKPTRAVARFGDTFPLMVEAHKEVESARRLAKKQHLVPLRPAVPRDVYNERRVFAKANATLVEQLPLRGLTTEPVVLVGADTQVATAEPVAFIQYLVEADKKMPCPTSKEGREAWVLSMSGLYQYAQ